MGTKRLADMTIGRFDDLKIYRFGDISIVIEKDIDTELDICLCAERKGFMDL